MGTDLRDMNGIPMVLGNVYQGGNGISRNPAGPVYKVKSLGQRNIVFECEDGNEHTVKMEDDIEPGKDGFCQYLYLLGNQGAINLAEKLRERASQVENMVV